MICQACDQVNSDWLLTNIESLKNHILQTLLSIIHTQFANEFDLRNLEQIHLENYNRDNPLQREILGYFENSRKTLSNFRPFPSLPSPNLSPTDNKFINIANDYYNDIRPYLQYFLERYEAAKIE